MTSDLGTVGDESVDVGWEGGKSDDRDGGECEDVEEFAGGHCEGEKKEREPVTVGREI